MLERAQKDDIYFFHFIHVFNLFVAFSILSYFLLPNTLWSHFSLLNPWLDYTDNYLKRIDVVALLIVSLLVFLSYLPIIRRRAKSFELWAVITLYTGTFLFTALAWHSTTVVIRNCFVTASAIICGLVIARLCRTSNTVVCLLCMLSAVQAIYTLLYYITNQDVFTSGNVVRAGGTFQHPDGVYTVMMLCLPLAVTCAIDARSSIALTFWMFLSAILFAALIITWDRGGILGASIALLWVGYRFFGSKAWVLLFGFLLMGTCMLVSYQRIQGTANQTSSARSINGRYSLWQGGIIVFQHNWLTGVGSGALEIPIRTSTLRGADGILYQSEIEPKNLFLHWLDEMGIGGGVLFILCLTAIYRVIKESSSVTAVGIGSAWFALLVAGAFDTPIGISARYYGNALVGALAGATILLTPNNRTALASNNSIEQAGKSQYNP